MTARRSAEATTGPNLTRSADVANEPWPTRKACFALRASR